MAGDVFISYRRARDSVAQRLEERLRDNGFADYQIFRDVRGLFPGENFERQLTDTLQRTKIVLLLLGPGDAPRPDAADWLTQELRAALRARRPVLPILLKGADKDLELWPAELDAVRLTQFLRFSATETSDDMKKLVAVLRRYGVRPLRALAQWSSLLTFNPVDDALDQLSGLTRDDAAPRGAPAGRIRHRSNARDEDVERGADESGPARRCRAPPRARPSPRRCGLRGRIRLGRRRDPAAGIERRRARGVRGRRADAGVPAEVVDRSARRRPTASLERRSRRGGGRSRQVDGGRGRAGEAVRTGPAGPPPR